MGMFKLSATVPVDTLEKGGIRRNPWRLQPISQSPARSRTGKYITTALILLGGAGLLLIQAYSATARGSAELPLSLLHGESQPATREGNTHNGEFQWTDITPSRKLEWHSCYNDEFDCARVDVPMDWLSPSEKLRVILAVIRLRAEIETTSPDYKGPIFFNPGGPGGSGIWAMRDRGRRIQAVAGRNHDIITFDPRGIGASVPRVDCWGTMEKQRIWDLQDVGVVGAHPGIVNDAFARATAFSQVCGQAMESSQLLYHISTPSHARDMLELLSLTGNDKLKYWGFSYGTILGGYFAALYPDKVERLVSDGNVDYLEWSQNKHINFNHDTDKVMDAFYRLCHKAGPKRCAFHAESPAAIKARLYTLLDAIKSRPITVPADSISGPDMPQFITWSRVRRFTVSVLYQPLRMFSKYARILAALEQGNGRPFYDHVMTGSGAKPFCSLETLPSDYPRLEPVNSEATTAIQCSDRPAFHDTLESFNEYTKKLMELSEAAGDVNAATRLMCVEWPARPKWNFDGPFGGITHHPILYVSNIADNITPLISARNNSAGFPGSVVLIQNSYGHTSLTAPSTCTASYIRAYFQNGTLPEEGTICEPDYAPFDDIPSAQERINALRRLSNGDEKARLALASLDLSASNWLLGNKDLI